LTVVEKASPIIDTLNITEELVRQNWR